MSEAPYDETIKMIQVSLPLGAGQSRTMTTLVTLTAGDEDFCLLPTQR